jgi:hypothetical protein
MWNGTNYVTCFRGLAIDTTGEFYPKPFIMGLNRSQCGGPNTSHCGCDECYIYSAGLNLCDLNKDPFFLLEYVNTGFEPVSERQQIQVASDSGPLKVMVKSILGTKYFMWKDGNELTPWAKSTGTEINNFYSPTIYYAEDANFPRWKLYFYVMKYPSDEIVPDCTKYTGFTTTLTQTDEHIIKNIVDKEVKQLENTDNNFNRSEKLQDMKKRISIPCVYLGPKIENENSCNCVKTIKYNCAIYGQCRRIGTSTDGVKICSACEKYNPVE